MSVTVSLRSVINEMAEVSEDHAVFVNRRTGEVVTLNEEVRTVLDNGYVPEALSEELSELREAHQSGDLLELPGSFEHKEFSIAEEFCHSLKDAAHTKKLNKALSGKCAFRDFRKVLRKLALEDAWRGFRNRALEQIAVTWLQQHDIAYDKAA